MPLEWVIKKLTRRVQNVSRFSLGGSISLQLLQFIFLWKLKILSVHAKNLKCTLRARKFIALFLVTKKLIWISNFCFLDWPSCSNLFCVLIGCLRTSQSRAWIWFLIHLVLPDARSELTFTVKRKIKIKNTKTFTRELNKKINEKNDECPRRPIRVKLKVRPLGVKST